MPESLSEFLESDIRAALVELSAMRRGTTSARVRNLLDAAAGQLTAELASLKRASQFLEEERG